MSTIRISSGRSNERVFAELRHVKRKTKRAIRHSWFDLADDLKKRANQEILRKPKSGRVYFVRTSRGKRTGGRRRRHVASAPGETHANLTGTLRKSIGWNVHGNNDMSFGYGIDKSSPNYDEFVEFGTRRMGARPSLENAVNFTQANAEQRFIASMNREFKT